MRLNSIRSNYQRSSDDAQHGHQGFCNLLPHRLIAPSQSASLLGTQPQPSTFPAAPAAYKSPQVIDLLQQLIQQLQVPGVSVLNFSPDVTASVPASMVELRQLSALKQQADQLLATIPLLDSGGSTLLLAIHRSRVSHQEILLFLSL